LLCLLWNYAICGISIHLANSPGNLAKLRQVARAIGKVNADAANGIVPEEAEQGRIQNLMGEVLSDTLPLKMRKLAFSLNLGFVKVSIETTRERKD
jgi:hypothetical protein